MTAQREVSADECALLVAVPLDHHTFIAQSSREPNAYIPGIVAAYGGNLDAAWCHYQKRANLILHAIQQVKKYGCAVMDCTTDALRAACDSYQVVTVVAHGADSARGTVIELSGGFITGSEFARCIPSDFTRVLHLISCESTRRLLGEVKERVPEATVITSQYLVDPLSPLVAYRVCLRVLAANRRRYTTTLADIAVAATES